VKNETNSKWIKPEWFLPESVEESLGGGTALSITCWLHGDIWWDPFQFLFSGQAGFYNGDFSPRDEFLACNRTSEAYLFDTNPTNLKTDVTHGIQEAGLPWTAVIDTDCSHKFYKRAKAMSFY
jgi:hypothetical protein